MNISCVKAVYYSAVGTTEKVVTGVAEKIAAALGVPVETYNFSLPENRTEEKPMQQMSWWFSEHRFMQAASRTRCSRWCRTILKQKAHWQFRW